MARLFTRVNLDTNQSFLGWDNATRIYEGYLSIKPSFSLNIDLGKKTLKWGKGYAWNPVAFIDRPKDPDDPELALEAFIVATADYIKSFEGPLKTLALTPILVPVYDNLNDTFGELNKLNFGGKLYTLLYDTDIDFLFLLGESKTNRFGLDFSRNITTNIEIHGEFAFIKNQQKFSIDSNSNGIISKTRFDAKSYLLGIRYLTS